MSKLTLHVDDELVRIAKTVAAERKVSVSKLVSDFFRTFDPPKSEGSEAFQPEALTPTTRSLIGILSEYDPEDYVNYLEEKYS